MNKNVQTRTYKISMKNASTTKLRVSPTPQSLLEHEQPNLTSNPSLINPLSIDLKLFRKKTGTKKKNRPLEAIVKFPGVEARETHGRKYHREEHVDQLVFTVNYRDMFDR